ncbi:GNAT family N-acetyltransferase [Brevundimonas sp. Root1279]|uniref:GNAT family N-acetyltransferase n=1 Tax=Brevundimonas sp. Root1279 TaxID=1736443 RepID=UPI0006F8E4F8|nr:GNAT family N-acetyltransferase [Brevundimonas sp. Root1279]KQW81827.1 hypothetical protein ASC65_11095 [Brevundimonas sp. Root1279]
MKPSRIDPAEIDLRPETPADADAVARIVREHLSEALAGLPPEMRDGPLLDIQVRGREAGLTAFPDLFRRVAVVGGQVAGLLLLDPRPETLHVVEIAVAGVWRRRGLASALLARVVDEARATGRPATASIFPGNAASLALFGAVGFQLETSPDAAQVRARIG